MQSTTRKSTTLSPFRAMKCSDRHSRSYGRSLLDLSPENIILILSCTSQADLAHLSRTCKALYLYATPILWHQTKLDLTVSTTTRYQSQPFNTTSSAALLNAFASSSVSPYVFSCIQQLVLVVGKSTTAQMVEAFTETCLLNPMLLRNLRSVTFNGPTWNNIEAIGNLIHQFERLQSVAIHDISLSCLAELALPVGPLNSTLTSLSLNFSSLNNNSSDIDLLSNLLGLFPNLRSFVLTFNYEFDLCDDPSLESNISNLFRYMAMKNPRIAKISIYDFPPYLHFNPQCLPPSTKEFVFHTNEIDCESLFLTQLFASCPAKLRSLSLHIAQSIDDHDFFSSLAAAGAAVPTPVALDTLTDLTFDTPHSNEFLGSLLKANQHQLSRLALSGLSTPGLGNILLYCRKSLRQLYIYSYATAGPSYHRWVPPPPLAFSSLVVKSILTNKFLALSLISLPPMPEDEFNQCALTNRHSSLPLVLSQSDCVKLPSSSSSDSCPTFCNEPTVAPPKARHLPLPPSNGNKPVHLQQQQLLQPPKKNCTTAVPINLSYHGRNVHTVNKPY